MKKLIYLGATLGALVPKVASAHCPLCTAGAGALAVLAASLGVSSIVVGILIGAFGWALGLWLAPLVKKQFVPKQKLILTVLIYLGTVIPIMPLVRDYSPLYVALGGDYGTLFHNTYTINLYVVGVIVGALIVGLSPYVSKLVTKLRGRQVPFQGLSITLLTLVLVSVIIQVLS